MINNNISLFFVHEVNSYGWLTLYHSPGFLVCSLSVHLPQQVQNRHRSTTAGLCEHAFSLSCKHIKKCSRVFTVCFVTDRKAVIVENIDVQACRVVHSNIIE